MSIFGAIKKAIFGDHGPLGGQFGGGGGKAPQPGGPVPGQSATAPKPPAQPAPGTDQPRPQGQAPLSPASPTPAAPAPAAAADVEKILSDKAAQAGQPLNWRTSIVDLMKLLGLDSSLAARKELADEIGYAGPKDGSAEMNIALHKAVMRKLAENGGKVPADLTD